MLWSGMAARIESTETRRYHMIGWRQQEVKKAEVRSCFVLKPQSFDCWPMSQPGQDPKLSRAVYQSKKRFQGADFVRTSHPRTDLSR